MVVDVEVVRMFTKIRDDISYSFPRKKKRVSERVSLGIMHIIRSETLGETFRAKKSRQESRRESRIELYARLPARLSSRLVFLRGLRIKNSTVWEKSFLLNIHKQEIIMSTRVVKKDSEFSPNILFGTIIRVLILITI